MPPESATLDSSRVPFSFELYPPRSASGEDALHETIRRLADAGPDFISVTYGAGGSTGGRSLEVLRFIRENTYVEPLAHLTCVGNTYAGAAALIREFLDAGILSFLALRGDPPAGQTEPFLGDLETSAQLVQLIGRVQAECAPYEETPIPGLPGAARITSRRHVNIAVAAFPKGHPRATHRTQDVEALLAKQAAGATFAITQLFFHPDDYSAFVERARAAGVTIPILPGIMPITSPARLARVLELTGEDLPSELAIALEIEPTAEGRREIGIEWAARLTREVVAAGAPGVHLYAFNQHDTVLTVLAEAGLLPALRS
ncbi:methylenetetrahydrofolate reductase [Microbacterium aerolatum]|uniref:Methylenetetrahydrofolate reductase n=1 Tax=Microbacterium aerolatum TaxID=153731 RepID=A0A511AFU1_9MICO|nr:methylenetetrahydrofolate reductase [Microbacterium aerolatum]GEK84877.1 methylenetetrahydrofolate reductase [Microbacterium aerolatum]GGB36903.1 methylenetetrahydrofolate reductase [Microbacterium aerolatum]